MTNDVLSELMVLLADFKTMGGIEATLVTSRGGVHLASLVPPNTNPETLAAMSSALQNAADIMTTQVNKSTPTRVVIECEHSKIVIVSGGPKALFVVLASENANLGPLFVEMDAIAIKIEELIELC